MKLNKLNTTQMDLISPLKMVLKMCTKTITYQPVTSQPHQRPRRVPMHHGARHNSHHRQLTHLIWCILFNHRIQLSIIQQQHRMETLPWRRQYRPVVQVKIQPNRAGSSKCYEKNNTKNKSVKLCLCTFDSTDLSIKQFEHVVDWHEVLTKNLFSFRKQ